MSSFYVLYALLSAILVGFCIYFFLYFTKEKNRLVRTIIQKQSHTEAEIKELIATKLHQDVGRLLNAVQYKLNDLEYGYIYENDISSHFNSLNNEITSLHEHLRDIYQNLYPQTLLVLGLADATQRAVATIKSQFGFKGHIDCAITENLETLNSKQLYFLFCLIDLFVTNSVLHSQADQITIQLTVDSQSLTLQLIDNGCGFDLKNQQRIAKGKGIFDIQSKAIALNPTRFSYESNPGKGTSLFLQIKLSNEFV